MTLLIQPQPNVAHSILTLVIQENFTTDTSGVFRITPHSLVGLSCLLGWDPKVLGRVMEVELDRDIAESNLRQLSSLIDPSAGHRPAGRDDSWEGLWVAMDAAVAS